MDGKFVVYFRVSTKKQGRSGLGINAQRSIVEVFLNGGRHKVVGELVEIESGKRSDNRPELDRALALCRAHKAKLLVAKLDRLARDVQFISTLMKSSVEFVACDLPEANNFTLHVMAAMAEYEAKCISERTKAALAMSKKKLGGRRMTRTEWDKIAAKGRMAGTEARSRAAIGWARDVWPVVEDIQAQGAATLREIAGELEQRGIPTRRGGRWSAVQVARMLHRREAA